jgi:hypothetical protein
MHRIGLNFKYLYNKCKQKLQDEPLSNGEPDQKARIFPHDINFAKRGGTKRKRKQKLNVFFDPTLLSSSAHHFMKYLSCTT